MKRISTSAVLIMCLALAASIPALATKDETDKTIAKVNGKTIPKSRADAMVAMQIAQGRPDSEQLRSAAKDIIARLKKGEKFEELAKQSKDPGSKDRGGDLGWAQPSNYAQPFAEAMIALEKGKYTEIPVKTNFGYHVIMLDDSRALKVPPFDSAKSQLLKRMQAQLVVKHVAELRAKAKIE